MPRNDVDALARQLRNHGLHARALEPDAGADGIDRVISRRHGDFRSAPCLSDDFLDLDDALVDLRHFDREQGLHEQWIGPRQDQPGASRRFLELSENRPDRLALAKPFTGVLLAPRDHGLSLPNAIQHDDDLASLDRLHLA